MAVAATPADGASAAFDLLRAQFLAGLPARWQEITGADGRACRAALHRLSGAAGSYGCAAVGQAARLAEQAAAAGDTAALGAALASLRDELRAAGVTVR